MPTTALIKFGTYTFNTSRDIKTSEEESDTVISTTINSKRHGVIVNEPVTLNAKIVKMTGRIKGSTIDAFKTAWYALTKALRKGADEKSMQKLYQYSAWFNYAYTHKFNSSHIKGSGGKAKYYNVEFMCADPFDYYDATGLGLEGYNDTDGQREDTLTVDSDDEVWAHANNGDVTQYPVITINATDTWASGFVIRNITTGEFIQVNTALSADDELVIDCRNITATLNGASIVTSLAGDSTMNMSIVEGNNSMSLENTGAGSKGTLKINYYDRYYP